MSARTWGGGALIVTVLLWLLPPPVRGQTIGSRVEAVDGRVAFHFKGRPGLEGCGSNGIRFGSGHSSWRGHWDDADCGPGPVLVVLSVRDGHVGDLDVSVGPRVQEDVGAARDLGRVAAPEASAYLLDLARTAPSGVAEDAVFPAFIADSVTVWPHLIALARDDTRPDDVRSSALFWVSQEAAGVGTAGLGEVAMDQDEKHRVREAAVFALSQRPEEEGVPILMDVARSAEDARTRKSAMFWLAQSEDPRVVDFFEELLLGQR